MATRKESAHRAAELAVYLARYAPDAPAHHIAKVVTDLQAAARGAKRQAEFECNYGYRTEVEAERASKRQDRKVDKLNAALAALMRDSATPAPTVELGGDPRGPCARLHIPGQRGDGWGDGFAIY